TASAIQVITGEEIRRSGATTLPEALRLASNLFVAQSNAHDWAITARGFNGAPLSNNTLADKLLVLIDGRTVYTPLFGGVFWDVQNVLLEDVDRIEVISGPGGALWGANAVNGVINVVTKSATESQGMYVAATGGSLVHDVGEIRYGGKAGSNLSYRVYGLRTDRNSTDLPAGNDANDAWDITQGGFRMDYAASEQNALTLQGDVYKGNEGIPVATRLDGQNMLGRWTRTFSDQSDLQVQMYFDRTWRQLPSSTFRDHLQTYDADVQQRFPLGARNDMVVGAGYRVMQDNVHNSVPLSINPEQRTLQLFNGFIQDEVALVPGRWQLTLGTKFEHNDYSGAEWEPSVRMAWTPPGRQTVWGAVSRSVRSPSRFDVDISTPGIGGDSTFDAEAVVAYELGYRVQPTDKVSLSIATFYNQYTDLRSINLNPVPPPPLIVANDQRGDSRGIELSGNLQVTEWWHLRGGYTYFTKQLRPTTATVVSGSAEFEGDDPNNQTLLQSIMDLPANLQCDVVARHVGTLPSPAVPAYTSADVRLGWHHRALELSVVGQNLLAPRHAEFTSLEIPRSVYGKIAVRW
ncbi:MAG TPA: TonB-dependent receptor plug domain-containing protein, partial [Gemmatimonadaceae bacterium]|nr:TonB-dependent receptor plug domain-containing protein [Gemmatimonadaceae bacterium]